MRLCIGWLCCKARHLSGLKGLQAACTLSCPLPTAHGVCWQGRPIYIQHLGQINMKKMYEVTTEERMLKFHVQEYERCARYIMPACSIVAGRHIDQTFAIIDLKGAQVAYARKWVPCSEHVGHLLSRVRLDAKHVRCAFKA